MKSKSGGVIGDPQAAELRERLRGLAPAQVVQMRTFMRLLAAGERRQAIHLLLEVVEQAPDHPEVLYWQARRQAEDAAWPEVVQTLRRAFAARPDDFRICWLLGSALGHIGEPVAAAESLVAAAACARSAADWLQLSIECDNQGLYQEALAAVEAHLRLNPRSPAGLLQRSRCHKALGSAEAAAADCRVLIAADREIARAWFSLVDLKTVALGEAERQRLEAAAARSDLPVAEQQMLGFALGKALEDAGQYARAMRVFQHVNQSVRRIQPWDCAGFERHVAEVRAAFAGPLAGGAPQGREVIFIVGLPRSGSTLVEQVLAAHPQVEGASELPYVNQVLHAESRRRGRPYPAWAAQANADDWARLGQDYLKLSARWRQHKPVATDKLPDNWLHMGAIRAMLPQARIIECRRDPLETCWSSYKQLFAPGLANFSYDFESLAQYCKASETIGDEFSRRFPSRVRIQSYEDLVLSPDEQIRAILDFCELPFDPACLQFQNAPRAIRTPSALQVRQPMLRPSRPAAKFGAHLDPLRIALGMPPLGAAESPQQGHA